MTDKDKQQTRGMICEFGKKARLYVPQAVPIPIEPGSEFDRDMRDCLARIEKALAADKRSET